MKTSDIEKYSSAVTLSDMEIFIFPELLYSLVLANMMSPVIWEWKKDPWFDNIHKMNPYRRILRLKQFIMDNYDFNLDLETWGLTTKEVELDRFKPFIDEDVISRSNALFGYEGDKYYFNVDIRKHFRLDKYDSNVIPYWKTETVEAMNAFKYREGYKNGAGECVSLSTLYAAALFIICDIPLEDIYLLATPLHSQNFVDVKGGLLTNNRRIVTKNMWFNGTELTVKAQRAMRNEQVTIISHSTGYVHVVYPEASIDTEIYNKFEKKLSDFLITKIDDDILCNFLRQESHFQKCFQVKHNINGKIHYIGAEKAYAYEHTSNFKVNKPTREKLFSEIDEYEFYLEPLENRIDLDELGEFFNNKKIDFNNRNEIDDLINNFKCDQMNKNEILSALMDFSYLEPRLPGKNKKFVESKPLNITKEMGREDIIAYLESIKEENITADLAFYAYRDFSRMSWEPFIKAAFERNPVAIEETKDYSINEIIQKLESMSDKSIYSEKRIAQPDEVWNFQRGDGLEKAICLANIYKNRSENVEGEIIVQQNKVIIKLNEMTIEWPSSKGLNGKIIIK
ncbi:hypothetical protein RH915_06045 [Serpentinicella sp. ANB-PHB4]|uniref:hypothetical protein n=1 Tax=Serpentinicella sp. ANB-PHB4 TaxID=3074076 RepID=UPI00286171BB|nr:hypothetical protein [Serpentinicella sp. ANB-PHB4]MDR5659045.1 hypothetical protein [Serpentinicella sp. ANB-PHB4]